MVSVYPSHNETQQYSDPGQFPPLSSSPPPPPTGPYSDKLHSNYHQPYQLYYPTSPTTDGYTDENLDPRSPYNCKSDQEKDLTPYTHLEHLEKLLQSQSQHHDYNTSYNQIKRAGYTRGIPFNPYMSAPNATYINNTYINASYPSTTYPGSVTVLNAADSSTDTYPGSELKSEQNLPPPTYSTGAPPPTYSTEPPATYYPPVLAAKSDAGKIRTKKKRTEFSQDDIRVLEHAFSVSDFARGARRDEIARQLNVRPRSVTIWFQNKRAKLRAQSHQMDMLKKAAETGVVSEAQKIPDFR